jgi:hypothetical protein
MMTEIIITDYQKKVIPGKFVKVYAGINGSEERFGTITGTKIIKTSESGNVIYGKVRVVLKEINKKIDLNDCYFCLDENEVIFEK